MSSALGLLPGGVPPLSLMPVATPLIVTLKLAPVVVANFTRLAVVVARLAAVVARLAWLTRLTRLARLTVVVARLAAVITRLTRLAWLTIVIA